MLSEGLDEFVPVGLFVLSELHNGSFQVNNLSGSGGSSSSEATLLTCKINVTEVLLTVLPLTPFDPYIKEALVI